MINIKNILLYTFLAIIFLPVFVFAQVGQDEEFSIYINPKIPSPGSQVFASVSGLSFDKNQSTFVWYLNGKTLASGIGKDSVSFVVSNTGGRDSLSVDVTTPNGSVLKDSLEIRPLGITLFWESDTYTPAFFKGKALHTYRSPIKVVAILDSGNSFSFNPRTDLNYEWRVNGDFVSNLSGFGRNTASINLSRLAPKSTSVSILIKDSSGKTLAQSGTIIRERSPLVVFYEDDPLLGKISNRSLNNSFGTEKEEVTIVVEPFYFARSDFFNNSLEFVWKQNGKEIIRSSDQSEITFGGGGASEISVSIGNFSRILQKAFNSLVIESE